MAGKQQKIRVVEYVHVGVQVVAYADLTPEQQRKADALIVREWMNGMFTGQAEFFAPEAVTGVPVPEDAIEIATAVSGLAMTEAAGGQ